MIDSISRKLYGHELKPFLVGYIEGIKTFDSLEGAADCVARDIALYGRYARDEGNYSPLLDAVVRYPVNVEDLERREKALLWLQAELIKIIEDEVFKN